MSTPKNKFYDDSFVKYTSPGSKEHVFGDETINAEEISRRYSIDSFSRSMNNQNQTTVMPSFNRFNAISENEFEEPDINQKSFHIPENTQNLHRLSTLQIRNLQTKPHLKSSYALEVNLPAVSENQIRGETNKENRMSQVNANSVKAYQKRRADDNGDPTSPKKSYTVINLVKI